MLYLTTGEIIIIQDIFIQRHHSDHTILTNKISGSISEALRKSLLTIALAKVADEK